jgi:DNA mismatch repair protein MutS2
MIDEAARAAQSEPVVAQALEAEEEIARSVEPGGRARVRGLGAEGVVVEFEGDWARMDMAGKRLRVRRSELEPVGPGSAKRKKDDGRRAVPPRTASTPSSAARDLSGTVPEIHVIGQHVEEAIEAVDKALDQALLSGASHLRVVHGHGTGRLREGLRDHFRGHASVASMRAGGKNEGGNGATILELR